MRRQLQGLLRRLCGSDAPIILWVQVGQSQWRRQQADTQPGSQRVRRCTTPRACMPYAHWARATAI